ncbi:MAG: bifunctional UDP-N-acetylglucosamine diphosphorylase/glucosamine-1-phosphate N-acetyltransferase GlmU [Agarilytica sp.]
MLEIAILAAGKGTRMCSNLPKVLHTLAGKPFLQHVLDRADELGSTNTSIIVGHGADAVKNTIRAENIGFIEQVNQLGTGHAVLHALPHLNDDATLLILYGDVPLIATETLQRLITNVTDDALGLLTVSLDDPTGYGRIVRDDAGAVVAIVEQKLANNDQLKIQEVNTGVMAVNVKDLQRWLPALSDDNAQKEYLLTDIIEMANAEGKTIVTAQPSEEYEVLGVNNRVQQAELERVYQAKVANNLLEKGVTLLDPQRFDCRGTLTVGKDCVIDVNCVFEGDVVLGDAVTIGPNCHIKDTEIASNVEIKSHSVLEGAKIGNHVAVGPFARLRPKAALGDHAKVGNFVEIKKSNIGENSKVSHLSYIGDAEVGDNVNVGAGTITCNYDGVNKFVTEIGDGVFVGSNTSLVAPVALGENVTVAAGSVVTIDVKEDALAVARSRQRNIDGWVRPTKK